MKNRKILLVEDNPDDADLTRRALAKNNIEHELVVVGDGDEALRYLIAAGRRVVGSEPTEGPWPGRAAESAESPPDQASAHSGSDDFEGGTGHGRRVSESRQQLHPQAGGLPQVCQGRGRTGRLLAGKK